jgi:hypothetical protein
MLFAYNRDKIAWVGIKSWDDTFKAMDSDIRRKLEGLRSDYQEVMGISFSHFYCPILFRDEDVDFCRAHIINRAFQDSDRRWTVQRADVDNFYGGSFEGEFTDIQYHGRQPLEQFFVDPDLSRRFRPQILLGEEVVPHFVARGPIPDHYTGVLLGGPSGEVRLGLKIEPDLAQSAMNRGFKLAIEKDLRVPALVSLLKAAHLTLFEMLGYRYALSSAGYLLGRTVLGEFFLRNRGRSKPEIIKNAVSHFGEFANMVRPVLSQESGIRGTISDGLLFVCFCGTQIPWAFIVFVRTGDRIHAVLAPAFDEPNGAAHFVDFLRSDGGEIPANRCRFEDNKWLVTEPPEMLMWPAHGLSN